MEKIKRNSEVGRLAQAMYEAWMGQQGALSDFLHIFPKFPKTQGAGPSVWVVAARVALGPGCPVLVPAVGDVWRLEDGCPPAHVLELSDADPSEETENHRHRLVRHPKGGDNWRWRADGEPFGEGRGAGWATRAGMANAPLRVTVVQEARA